MSKKVIEKTRRKRTDGEHDEVVREAVEKGADTFGKIAKAVPELDKPSIHSARNRLVRDKRIFKNGSRYNV